MPDEITLKHLRRLRIRGAPSTVPGMAGFVGSYDAEETWRQTSRALVVPLDRTALSPAALRAAFERLAGAVKEQKLTAAEDPLFALKGDPSTDPPHKWEYEAVLPVRGAARPDGDVKLARVEGGMHIATLTARGLPDLHNVYVYLFGKFLPEKKQQLMRPYILHRVIDGLDQDDEHAMAVSVFVPAVLSIKPVPVPGEGAQA